MQNTSLNWLCIKTESESSKWTFYKLSKLFLIYANFLLGNICITSICFLRVCLYVCIISLYKLYYLIISQLLIFTHCWPQCNADVIATAPSLDVLFQDVWFISLVGDAAEKEGKQIQRQREKGKKRQRQREKRRRQRISLVMKLQSAWQLGHWRQRDISVATSLMVDGEAGEGGEGGRGGRVGRARRRGHAARVNCNRRRRSGRQTDRHRLGIA